MDPIELSYASPERQVTRRKRIKNGLHAVIRHGGWMVLGLGFVIGITFLAWLAAGVIVERRTFWWNGGGGGFAWGPMTMAGQLAGFIGLTLAAMLLVIWGHWRRVARVRRSALLLSQLRLAVDMNLPLPALIAGAAKGERGRVRRQLLLLEEGLTGGATIAIALQHAAPELPLRILETVAAAEQTGTLGPALARLLDEQGASVNKDVAGFAVQRMYALITFLMFGGVMATLMVYVVPKFEQIMKDFHTEPPTIFKMVTGVFRDLWPFGIFLMLWLMFFTTLSSAARAVFIRKAPVTAWRWLADRVKWALPITHGLARDRGLADTCELLADGLERGRPAASALGLAILPTTNRVLVKKLMRWHAAVAQGRSLHEGAADAHLPRLVTGMLAPAHYTSGAAEALRFLSRHYRDRNERLLLVLRAAFTPAATLLLGVLVMLAAFTVFLPFLMLIQNVSAGNGHGVRP